MLTASLHAHTFIHRPGPEETFMVRLADVSGRPVVEGTALPVAEGDLWAFFASKSRPETRPLQGSEPRVIFGWGWSVPRDHGLEPPPDGWDR